MSYYHGVADQVVLIGPVLTFLLRECTDLLLPYVTCMVSNAVVEKSRFKRS